jgi:hypothetical protein
MALVTLPLKLPVIPPVTTNDPVTSNPFGKSMTPEIKDAVSAEVALPESDPVIPAYTDSECNLCVIIIS